METGAVTANIDVAQVVLYAFWLFFAGLIFYLRREDRREGYPLEGDDGKVESPGLVWIPDPKTFRLPHGGESKAPNALRDSSRELKARRLAVWPGAPSEPTGNRLLDGVGPGAYALRADEPDRDHHGAPKIVPLSSLEDFVIAGPDADPHGMTVVGADRKTAGRVVDLWVDRAEQLVRYLEVELEGADPRRILLPMTFAVIERRTRRVQVGALLAAQFAEVPGTATPGQVTMLEEERICACFGAGLLYATPARAEPWI